MIINKTVTTIKVMTLAWNDCGAYPKMSIIGNPRMMAGNVCKTKLLEAGVSNLGSISRNKIIPLLAVPVNMPNMLRNPSLTYVGYKCFAAAFKYKNVAIAPKTHTNINGKMNSLKSLKLIAAVPATIITSKQNPLIRLRR